MCLHFLCLTIYCLTPTKILRVKKTLFCRIVVIWLVISLCYQYSHILTLNYLSTLHGYE